jgi:glycosyltransferase involved in cell wall biosynthesis
MNVAPRTTEDVLISVVTPSYNRCHTLMDAYKSLLDQDVMLEWIVVDDGSTDDTAEAVKAMAEEAPFPVSYVRQTHAGKHIAVNRGVSLARGTLVGLLDSDDQILPGALDRLVTHWNGIQDKAGYVGVTGLVIEESGRVMGERFCADAVDANWQEMRYRYRIKGEKWGLQRADVLRAHPFPQESGFVIESIIWREIGKAYRTRYVNDVLLRKRLTGSDRLSVISFQRRAHTVGQHYKDILSEDLQWFINNPIFFAVGAAQFSRALFHDRVPVYRQAGMLPRWSSRILWAAAVPVGWFFYLRDRKSVRQQPTLVPRDGETPVD